MTHPSTLIAWIAAKVPTPPPIDATPIPKIAPAAEPVAKNAKGYVEGFISFISDNLLPNMWGILTLLFLTTIAFMLFAGVNIAVRYVSDPFFQRLLRPKTGARAPILLGSVISVIVTYFILKAVYHAFPALHPSVGLIKLHFQ
ncbi:hypothetical protein KDL45_06745 [bacterium]|nr:hypothetical protein [bacterium]